MLALPAALLGLLWAAPGAPSGTRQCWHSVAAFSALHPTSGFITSCKACPKNQLELCLFLLVWGRLAGVQTSAMRLVRLSSILSISQRSALAPTHIPHRMPAEGSAPCPHPGAAAGHTVCAAPSQPHPPCTHCHLAAGSACTALQPGGCPSLVAVPSPTLARREEQRTDVPCLIVLQLNLRSLALLAQYIRSSCEI